MSVGAGDSPACAYCGNPLTGARRYCDDECMVARNNERVQAKASEVAQAERARRQASCPCGAPIAPPKKGPLPERCAACVSRARNERRQARRALARATTPEAPPTTEARHCEGCQRKLAPSTSPRIDRCRRCRRLKKLARQRRHRERLEGVALARPVTRGDCLDGPRPCPWLGCRHHLGLDVVEGPRRRLHVLQPTETCSLDVAARGALDADQIATILGQDATRVRQVIASALGKLGENAHLLALRND